MNVSAPYEAVVPTLDGPVLAALAKLTAPVTGRQVHDLAGAGSEAGIRNVLNRLVNQGLVSVFPAGSAYLYSVNREHVAWPAVQALADIRGEFLSRLRSQFDTWSVRARSAALYGSAARADGDASSDIDLLIIRQNRVDADDPTWTDQLAKLRERIEAWTGNHAQVYELDGDELARHISARERIVDRWRADAITVAGADLRNLLRELGHRAPARSGR